MLLVSWARPKIPTITLTPSLSTDILESSTISATCTSNVGRPGLGHLQWKVYRNSDPEVILPSDPRLDALKYGNFFYQYFASLKSLTELCNLFVTAHFLLISFLPWSLRIFIIWKHSDMNCPNFCLSVFISVLFLVFFSFKFYFQLTTFLQSITDRLKGLRGPHVKNCC